MKTTFKEEVASLDLEQDKSDWNKLFCFSEEEGITAGSYTKIVLLKEIILEESLLMDKSKSNSSSFKSTVFIKTFIDKGGFKFLAFLFAQVKLANLNVSLLSIKTLTQLISVFVNFFSKNLFISIVEQLDEQMIFDLFSKNLDVLIIFVKRVKSEQNRGHQVKKSF